MIAKVGLKRFTAFPKIVHTRKGAGVTRHSGKRREQQRHEDSQDGQDNKKLYQREGPPGNWKFPLHSVFTP